MDRLEEVFQQIADSEQFLGKQQTEITRIDKILEDLKIEIKSKEVQCKEALQEIVIQEETSLLSEAKRDTFNSQVGQFVSEFGFTSDGRMNRENGAHREFEELKKQQITLEAGLRVGVKNKEQVERLREELKNLQQVSNVIEQQYIEYKEELDRQTTMSNELILKKSNLSNAPRSDVEFVKLQEELDRERTLGETLETNVQRLQQQLSELQQIHWQQQLDN